MIVKTDKAKHRSNPFLADLSDVVSRRVVDAKQDPEIDIEPVYNGETGEVSNEAFITTQKQTKVIRYDSRFVKLMVDNISVIASLNPSGMKMFSVLVIALSLESKNKDYCHLTLDSSISFGDMIGVNITKTIFYRGVESMVASELLARSTSVTRYWLNVGVLFNGEFSKLEAMKRLDPVYFAENMTRKSLKNKG
jgi:hypothetical protein